MRYYFEGLRVIQTSSWTLVQLVPKFTLSIQGPMKLGRLLNLVFGSPYDQYEKMKGVYKDPIKQACLWSLHDLPMPEKRKNILSWDIVLRFSK